MAAYDEAGRVVFPREATGKVFSCIDCGEPLALKRGLIRKPHFSHINPCTGSGESAVHLGTKHWIGSQVSNSAFAIVAECPCCKSNHTVFRGGPEKTAVVEMAVGRFRADVGVTEKGAFSVAIEVVHTHPVDPIKASAIRVIEVGAIDVVEAGYPMKFQTVAGSLCPSCGDRSPKKRQRPNPAVADFVRRHRLLKLDTDRRSHLTNATDLPRRLTIQAPAGSGKTTLLFAMARQSDPLKVLVLTFNRDLAEALQNRAPPNTTVMTFDAAIFKHSGMSGSLGDRAIEAAAFPKCPPFRKKGMRGFSTIAAAHLGGAHVTFCDYHKQVGSYGLRKAEKLPSFAAGRHLVANSAVDITAGFDRVFVDESQDLTAQAVAIICRSAAPVVFVGDVNQRIYSFGDSACAKCKIQWPAVDLPPPVVLYRSFRSPQTAISRAERFLGVKSVSTRRRGATFRIAGYRALAMVATKSMAVLARSNEAVYTIAEDLARRGLSPGVVGGSKTAASIRSLARLKAGKPVSPLHAWVRRLGAGAGAAADFLETNSADIDDSETLLVSTVHRAKGSEHRHVAVEKSIVLSDEREVHYVATTRHKSVLFVVSLD